MKFSRIEFARNLKETIHHSFNSVDVEHGERLDERIADAASEWYVPK